MKNATAQDCAEAILHRWISRFGVSDNITSDRGPAFLSQLWTSLGELLGANLDHTTAYNPAANGMVERTHRTLKAALMARCTRPDWKAQLPWVLLGIQTAPKQGLSDYQAEMVFGDALVVPPSLGMTLRNHPSPSLTGAPTPSWSGNQRHFASA
ncbi:uncharacterized protein LOC135096932 [Scylla paramamosain]|uniref:uncharacterized protein LOC135096932 n=1 Tax=Scylla paramamosain TaxID=85552 RepID=UPI0030832DD8